MPLIDDVDRRREIANRHRENSGRLAQSYMKFETTGTGTFEYEKRVKFGVIFVDKPTPAWCGEINTDDLEDVLGYVALPLASGLVTEWDTDEHQMYVGCWVAVRVDFPVTDMIDPSVAVTMTHHFTFAGVALKDITPELSV